MQEMYQNDNDKVFFLPGDLVSINKDIPNKPIMMVVKKETLTFRPSKGEKSEEYFQGIRCRWFTTDGTLQEAVWSTKDIYKIQK